MGRRVTSPVRLGPLTQFNEIKVFGILPGGYIGVQR
jgi:hypothetical protein